MKTPTTKAIVLLVVCVLILVGILFYKKAFAPQHVVINPSENTSQSIASCYYRSVKTNNGLFDRSWLRINQTETAVTGDFRNYPAEKDSKVGTFAGTIDTTLIQAGTHTATVWWDSLAEGMRITEELLIKLDDKMAQAAFGEMSDRNDGVYVYKDKTQLTYSPAMNKIDCVSLDEIVLVEKYVRDNIKTLAPNREVLGGSWYVSSATINPDTNTGTVSYEDGHITSTTMFDFSFDPKTQAVTVSNIKLSK